MAAPRPSSDVNSAAAFAEALTAARVVDAVQLRPFAAEFRAAGRGGSDRDFAAFLVETGLITEFQAERTLAGQAAKLLLGPYLLATPIGSGSLGTVFQAVNRQDRKKYAVKVLPLRSLWNVVQAKQQLGTFGRLAAHPHVIPFVDVDSAAGSHYLAWQYAEGKPLDAAVRKSGPRPVDETREFAAKVADALAAVHAAGIVHGLFKPSNVLVAPDGTPRILDLGVGAILTDNIADDESMLDTISTANAAMGMLDCCAPETINSPTVRTPAGDCYSFGCVLYFALTGRLPFPDGNAIDKVMAHQTAPPPKPSALNPAVPAWLDDVVAALMAKDPKARPRAEAVAATLRTPPAPAAADPDGPDSESALEGTPLSAPPVSRLAPLKPATASRVEFELPEDETTDPGLSLPSVSGRDGWDEATDHLSQISTAGPVPSSTPVPMIFPATQSKNKLFEAAPISLRVAPPKSKAPTDDTPPAPVQYSDAPAAPAPAAAVPPLPAFARSVSRRLSRALLFWRPWGECVQISIFGPRSVSPGESFKLQVFTHTPESFDSVCTLSRAFLQNGEMTGCGFVDKPVYRGTPIGLHLAVTNAAVSKSLLEVTWLGQPQPRTFDIYVPWESPAGATQGVLSAGLGKTLVGKVGFRFDILPRRA